jgi:DNA-binding LacI/PurR family transcriptional regulator
MPLKLDSPKSRQIASYLLEEINSGKLPPGSQVYSLRNLAEKYSVSNAVVVSAYKILEKQNLIVREAGRGTFVKEGSSNKACVYGVVTNFEKDSLYGYYEALDNASTSFDSLYMPVVYNDLTLNNRLKMLKQQRPDGVFIDLDAYFVNFEDIRCITDSFPVCFVQRWLWDVPLRGPAVIVDEESHYRTAFKYLFSQGHKRICITGAHIKLKDYYQQCIKKAAESLGYKFPSYEISYVSRRDFRGYPERIEEIFGVPEKPSAIIGLSDYLILMFEDGLSNFFPNIEFEEKVGFHNTNWSQQPGAEFHSFHINHQIIWQKAFQLMKEGRKKIEYIKPELIIREKSEI